MGDPAIQISDTDRKTWHDTALTLHEMQAKANDLANHVNDAWSQYQAIQQQTKNMSLPPALKTEMEATSKELEAVRRRLGLAGGGGGGFGGGAENVRGRIGQVKGAIMGSTSLPTEVQMRQLKELQGALPKLIVEANTAASKVPQLLKQLVTSNVFPTPSAPLPQTK